MRKKMSPRKLNRAIRSSEKKAAKEMKKLNNIRPDLFRRCGGDYCCQAITKAGVQCNRKAMLGNKTYIKDINCCMLCWQHAAEYGLYTLYSGLKFMNDSGMSWDEYCIRYPEYCLEIENHYEKVKNPPF